MISLQYGKLPQNLKIREGEVTVTASVDNNTGTPSVVVTQTDNSINLAFKNLKGRNGVDGKDGTSPSTTGLMYNSGSMYNNVHFKYSDNIIIKNDNSFAVVVSYQGPNDKCKVVYMSAGGEYDTGGNSRVILGVSRA